MMPDSGLRRRVTERTARSGEAPPDLNWPMDVALIGLGTALATATVLAHRSEGADGLGSAWPSIATMAVLLLAAIAISRWISHHWIRRSTQFAVLVSLMVHLALVMAAAYISLPAKPWTAKARVEEVLAQRSRQSVPDFHRHTPALGGTGPDFAQPVDSAEPLPILDLLEREETAKHPVAEIPWEPVAGPEPSPDRVPLEKEEPSEVMPRQSDEMGRISRQVRVMPSRLSPDEVVVPVTP
jgi:hypothetical protein